MVWSIRNNKVKRASGKLKIHQMTLFPMDHVTFNWLLLQSVVLFMGLRL